MNAVSGGGSDFPGERNLLVYYPAFNSLASPRRGKKDLGDGVSDKALVTSSPSF